MVGAPALASARGTAALLVLLAALPAAARATAPLVAEGGCRDGEPNGAYTLRVADGRLRVAGAFARGHRTGTFVFWSDRGSRVAVVPYDDDRKTGTIAVWYPPSAPSADAPRKSESAYVDDRLHGEKRSWFASGKPRTRLRYERGQLVEARAWNAAGAPLSEAAARAQAVRDAAADEAFYATLEALVAEHRPNCEALHNDENRSVTLPNATKLVREDLDLVPFRFQSTTRAGTKNVACTPCTDEHAVGFPFRPTGRSL